MPASTLTPTVVERGKTSAELIAIFTLAIGAGDYAAGGLAFTSTFSQVAGWSNRKPNWVVVEGISGYEYRFNYSTGKLMIFQDAGAGNPSAEIPTAATPAAVVADTIRARVGHVVKARLTPNS